MEYDLNSNLFIVYEIKVNGEWKEVTKKEWIQEERSAGFKPKGVTDYWQSMNTCATGGFSGYNREGRQTFRFLPSHEWSRSAEKAGVEWHNADIEKGFMLGLKCMYELIQMTENPAKYLIDGTKEDAARLLGVHMRKRIDDEIIKLNSNDTSGH